MVPKEIAVRVAQQEVAAMNSCLMGLYGNEKAIEAARRGLHGIVEEMTERKGGWDIRDMITGQLRRKETIRARDLKIGDTILYTDPKLHPVVVASICRGLRDVQVTDETGEVFTGSGKDKLTIVRVVGEGQ